MHKAVLPVLTALVLGTAAAPAAAAPAGEQVLTGTDGSSVDWSPWKASPFGSHTVAACGVQVRITAVVDETQIRTRPLPAGAAAVETRGRSVLRFTVVGAPERSVTRDDSGRSVSPDYSIAYANGDFLFRSTGANFFHNVPAEVRTSGLPALALTYGRTSVLFHGTRPASTADVIDPAGVVVDVCHLLRP